MAVVYEGRVKERQTPALQIWAIDKRSGEIFKIPTG